MTKWLVLLVLLALAAALYRSYPAQDGELLYLGSTGIFCVQEPCPSRGLYPPLAQNALPAGLLYSGLHGNAPPPPLRASDPDRTRLEEAWRNYGCLALEGQWQSGDEPLLTVTRVLGDCQDFPLEPPSEEPQVQEAEDSPLAAPPPPQAQPLDPQPPEALPAQSPDSGATVQP